VYRKWLAKNPQFPVGTGNGPLTLENKRNGFRQSSFGTEAGGEPLRDWLKSLPSSEDRKRIEEELKDRRIRLATRDAGVRGNSVMAFMKYGRDWL
jgi:hypothetical protein